MQSKILIVSPTAFEVSDLTKAFDLHLSEGELVSFNPFFSLLISGIGIAKTTFNLTKVLSDSEYVLLINVGLAGAYDVDFKLGTIVNVISDCFADMGISAKERMISMSDLGYEDPNSFPFQKQKIINSSKIPEFFQSLPVVKSVTVNSLLIDNELNNRRKAQFEAQVETMEGAAFAFVAEMLKIPYLQIRVISNIVGERDKSKWLIEESINSLNTLLRRFII